MSSMGEWWHDLWNDPVNENPWAFGAYLVCVGLLLAALVGANNLHDRWRRKRGATVSDRENWPTKATDGDEARQTDELGRPRHPEEGTKFEDGETGARYVFHGGEWRPLNEEGAKEVAERVIAESRAEGWRGPEAHGLDDSGDAMDEKMRTDPRLIADPLGAPIDPTSPAPIANGPTQSEGEFFKREWLEPTAAPQPGRNILAGSPVTAAAKVPLPRVSPQTETCAGCGTVRPGIADLLRETAGWITDMDGVVTAFYQRMMELARLDAERVAREAGRDSQAAGDAAVADLAFIFPHDLITATAGEGDSRGAAQRDKLAKALVALATMFDPADADQMQRLDNAIVSMGNRHDSFVRRDGTMWGAELGEYNLAKRALFDVLATLGPRFTALHGAAWSLAYDYVAGGMMVRQQKNAVAAPRFPAV